jgi:hypothetical protein
MTLELTMTVDRTVLRYQEDANCSLGVTNQGQAPVTTVLPTIFNSEMLRLRTINVKTGLETVHAPPPPRPGHVYTPSAEQSVKPGQSYTFGMALSRLPGVLLPGTYEISAILLYNRKTEKAESPPVRVEIRPTTPRNLHYEDGCGVWVNVHADPPEVLLSTFVVGPGGGLSLLYPVGPAVLQAAPVFSQNTRHYWVAWTQGAELKFTHVHVERGASPLRSFPLSSPEDLVVAPLHSDPVPDDDSRPGGTLLLYRASGDLETLRLGLDKAVSLARAPIPGSRPLWISSFGRGRSVLAVQADGDKVSLLESSWPDAANRPSISRKLGEWTGTFMGAGLGAGAGTILLRQLEGARLAWDRISFTLDARGAFTATTSQGPVSDAVDPFEAAPRVRQGGVNTVAALLRTSKGFWWVYDGDKTVPVPHDLRQALYPLDVEFFDARSLILIAGFREAGFHLRMADGNPLPTSHD